MEVAAVPAETEDRREQHGVVNGKGVKSDHWVGHYPQEIFRCKEIGN